MREVVLVDGMRTAFGKRGGSLKTFNGTDLAVLVAKALLNKTQLRDILEPHHKQNCRPAPGENP